MVGEGVPNIVVPTCRDLIHFAKFLENWKEELQGCHLIIVEDREQKIFSDIKSLFNLGFTYEVHDWCDIDADLKEKSWIISRHNSAIRCYGYYRAWLNKALFVVTLDDDTRPSQKGHIKQFWKNLFAEREIPSDKWLSTLKGPPYSRGTLISGFDNIVISHGGWLCNADLNAEEQISQNELYGTTNVHDFNEMIVPVGTYYPMCGMNLAFKPEVIPHLYFGLQGSIKTDTGSIVSLRIDRSDDIWAGIWSKKKIDERDGRIMIGGPYVVHERASNVWSNLVKEKNAYNWTSDFFHCFLDKEERKLLIDSEAYWGLLERAYKEWYSLFGMEME